MKPNWRLMLTVYRLEVNKGIAIETIHYLNDGLWHMKPIKWRNQAFLHLQHRGLTQNAIITSSGCVAFSRVRQVGLTQLPCFDWDGERFDIYLKLCRKCQAGPGVIEDKFCYWPLLVLSIRDVVCPAVSISVQILWLLFVLCSIKRTTYLLHLHYVGQWLVCI